MMKTNVKFFGFALAAAITFILVACNNPFFPAKRTIDNSGLPQQLAAPTNLQINGTTLTWDAVTNASSYMVDIDGTEYPSASASFSLSVLTNYKNYTIKVKALGDGEAYTDSVWSSTKSYSLPEPQGIPALATPVNLQINETNLTWDVVADAVKYSVDINDMENVAAANSYSLSALTVGTYMIRVKAVGDNVTKKNSLWSDSIQCTVTAQGISLQLATPTNLQINLETKTLTWNAVSNAVGYSVQVDDNEAAGNGNSTTFSLEFLAYGIYSIKVKATGNGTTYTNSEWSEPKIYEFENKSLAPLNTPANLEINGTNLTWGEVIGAISYLVDIDGAEHTAATNTYSLASLTEAGTYTIKVKAIGDNVTNRNSEWSGTKQYTVTTQGAGQQLAAPSNLKIDDAVLTWNAVSNASGYSVQVDDTEPVNNGNSTSYSLESLDYGTYSIKVKAIGNGTTYTDSEWSQAIIYEFEDPSLTPDPIAFTDTQTRITKTYGDAAFTNAITGAHSGSGAIAYSSGDETVATVNGSGTVSIHKAGTAVITAHKVADTVYAGASKSYTLEVEQKAVTITGLGASSKFYDGTTAATVTGTAQIVGLIGGDTVTVNYGSAAFASADVGSGKTVAFSGFTLGGAHAGNYTLPAQPQAVTANIIDAELKPPMIQINADNVSFTMGSPEGESGRQTNETQHQVTLTKGFYMGKYPVTQEQYEAVMGSNPSNFSSSPAAGETQGRRPVEWVSWYDALVFCNKLSMLEDLSPAYEMQTSADTSVWSADPGTWGNIPTGFDTRWNAVRIAAGSDGYRLPTEAQWEYACRAGTTTAYNLGGTWNDDWGWVNTNSNSMTHEVGKKAANAWGLYDMHGNVYEWCWDWYDANYGGVAGAAVTDPTGSVSGDMRVLHGGSWDSQNWRSAYRGGVNPRYRGSSFGFRLVRPAIEE
jgi:formylglycine-generating enzyme required for sulfatase activity